MSSKNNEIDGQDGLFFGYHHEGLPVPDISTQGHPNPRTSGGTEPGAALADEYVKVQIAENGSLERTLKENAILKELVIILGYLP